MKKILTLALLLTTLIIPATPHTTRAAQHPVHDPPQTQRPAADKRQAAISILMALADEARDFRDVPLQARVQALAADALYAVDQPRAVVLFKRAWAAAAAADAESEKKIEEARRPATTGGGPRLSVLPLPSNIRGEVIRLSARHDQALAESFFTDIERAASEDQTPAPATQTANPMDAPPPVRQRLEIARKLAEAGDVEPALRFAGPALDAPYNLYAAYFLDALRERAPAAADGLYLRACARAASDPAADGNTVSLLSSYVFTPRFYVTFSPAGGSSTMAWRETPTAPPTLPARVTAAFFNTAGALLLRTPPPPDQDRSTAGRGGLYMIITRLLPRFATHRPDRVAELEARRSQLLTTPFDRAREERVVKLGQAPTAEQRRAEVAALLDDAKKARTSEERDALYTRAATATPKEDLAAALEVAGKIEDTLQRSRALTYIKFREAERLTRTGKLDEALAAAAGGDLPPLLRAWIYEQCAHALKDGDAERAAGLVEEAARAAARLEVSSPERAYAFAAAASRAFELDETRGWQLLTDAVRAANSARDFTGRDAFIAAVVQTKISYASEVGQPTAFNIGYAFTLAASADLYRAEASARSLDSASARATALLAAARAALNVSDPDQDPLYY